MKIGIIGGGVWGSALAKLLSYNKVYIFARDSKVVKAINDHHFNPKLKYAVFNNNVSALLDFDLLQDMDYVFIALPSQSIRNVLSSISFENTKKEIIIASKGIEIDSGLLLSEVVKETTKSKNISILSGPCFSHEVAQNLPTAATFASSNKRSFENISKLFQSKNFRMYYSEDIIGAQIGGALKNIYAIAAGITEGLNLGENARSALVTRSIVELVRFANFFRANQETIFGLSGLGDLILTCNSLKSRNTNFGKKIANTKFENYEDILNTQQITEGYFTVKAVNSIAEENKINMPIMKSVYNILYKNHDIKNEIKELMNRPLIEEKI